MAPGTRCSDILTAAALIDGVEPSGTLIEGSDGALCGTTFWGGSSGNGIVFRLALDDLKAAGRCPENRPEVAHRRAGVRVHQRHATEALRPDRLQRPGATPIRRPENLRLHRRPAHRRAGVRVHERHAKEYPRRPARLPRPV